MNKIIQLLLVFSLIFIVGCNGGGNDSSGGGDTFIGGSEGLTVEFKELAPRLPFEKGDLVDFALLIKNFGEEDVAKSSMKVQLDGVKFEDWSGLNNDWKLVTSGINGVNKDFPDANELEVNFGKASYVGDLLSGRSFTFGAKVCYPYKTKTDIGTCVSSKRIEEENLGEPVCDISGEKVKSTSVSKGPVQVTSVTETFLGSNSIKFDINFENSGEGIILDREVDCDGFEAGNTGTVHVVLPDDYKCTFPDGGQSNEGDLSLQTGSKILRCELEATGNFEDRLIMEIDYKYIDSGSVTVEVSPAS